MIPAFRSATVIVGLLMTTAAVAGAQGAHFGSFRTERYDVWNDVPAYRARTYIAGSWGAIRDRCRIEPPSNRALLDVAGYVVMPADDRFGMGGGVFRLQVAAEDNAFLVRADPEGDVGAFVRGTSCAPAAHRSWLAATEKFLADQRLGGSIQEFAMAACTDDSTPRPGTDCGCFARALDMEASPARRRALLDATDVRAAFRQALSNTDFATRVGYKCGTVPDFVTAPLPTTTLRHQQLRTLSTQTARWAGPDRNAGLPAQVMPGGRTVGQVMWDLDQRQIRATKLPIQLHVCSYGPATYENMSGVDDDNTYLFWKGAVGPSEAELRSALAGYRHLERVIELAAVRINACPASLSEARALRAGPPLIQPAPPAAAPDPAVQQRATPRAGATTPAPAPGASRSPTVAERRRQAQEERCRNMERQLTEQRAAARAGRVTARALARSEALYKSNCG